MFSRRLLVTLVVVMISVALSTAAVADTVNVVVAKDASIFLVEPETANGQGDLFCGQTGGATLQRCLLAFDIAADVPAGSTITRVELTLKLIRGSGEGGTENLILHRLLQDWGEGASIAMGGGGAPAIDGDVTWSLRFFGDDATAWNNPGGDLQGEASAVEAVGVLGADVVWSSTAELVADVQAWLDNPDDDFGWIILGNEIELNTARRFASRETEVADDRPMLAIEFEPPGGGMNDGPAMSLCGAGVAVTMIPCLFPILVVRCRRHRSKEGRINPPSWRP